MDLICCIDEKTENQRYYWTTRKWSYTLLPADPDPVTQSKFVSLDGCDCSNDELALIRKFDTLGDQWIADRSKPCDRDGYRYAFSFEVFDSTVPLLQVHASPSSSDWVRRRILKRVRIFSKSEIQHTFHLKSDPSLDEKGISSSADQDNTISSKVDVDDDDGDDRLKPPILINQTSYGLVAAFYKRFHENLYCLSSSPTRISFAGVLSIPDHTNQDQIIIIAKESTEWEQLQLDSQLNEQLRVPSDLDYNDIYHICRSDDVAARYGDSHLVILSSTKFRLRVAAWNKTPSEMLAKYQHLMENPVMHQVATVRKWGSRKISKLDNQTNIDPDGEASDKTDDNYDDQNSQTEPNGQNGKTETTETTALENDEHEIGAEERAYIAKRFPKVKAVLEQFLGRSLTDSETPIIACAYSGGGYRAFTSAIGHTQGLEDIGLYDAVMYSGGVSGGGWFHSSWFWSSLKWEDYVQDIRNKFDSNPFIGVSPFTLHKIYKLVERHNIFRVPDKSSPVIDYFGAMLGNNWTKDSDSKDSSFSSSSSSSSSSSVPARLERTVTGQLPLLGDGDRPVPIYNCVKPSFDPDNLRKMDHYEWFEFSPFEMTALDSRLAIPMWAFGREFKDGKSINFAPEQSIHLLMGTVGSAFCASIEEMHRCIQFPSPVMVAIQSIAPSFSKERLIARPTNYHFGYGIPQSLGEAQKTMQLVDGGVYINAPLPPFFRKGRNVDLVFVFDARPTEDKDDDTRANNSKDVLRPFEKYCRERNIKCPPIVYEGIGVNNITVCHDEKDPTVPTIIYMPFVRPFDYVDGTGDWDPDSSLFCDMAMFSYSNKNFDRVKNLNAYNVSSNKDKIKEVLMKIVASKSSSNTQVASSGTQDTSSLNNPTQPRTENDLSEGTWF